MNLREQVNRLFDESVGRAPARDRREGMPQRAWAPPVDITEDKDQIVLKVDLPGVKQEDIDVELEGETLTIRGERQLPEQGTNECVRAERVSGPFLRTFSVVTPVQADKISASYRDGVLTITVPKAEESKPRRIQIVASS
jgi:HSP20 family protein